MMAYKNSQARHHVAKRQCAHWIWQVLLHRLLPS